MLSAVLLALTATSALAAPVQKAAPSGWAQGYLEDYQTYHTRYLAIGCQNQHDTQFFDDCCHPLLATETVGENRKAYCSANSTELSSASAYEATATSVDNAATAFANATASVYSVYESAEATATVSVSSTDDSWTTALGGAQYASASEEASSTTTSVYVEPTTTSTYVEPTTTSTSSEAAQTTSSGSSDVKTGGYATYFYQGGNAGACGTVHSDYDKIVAIDGNGYWQNYGVTSEYCGKWLTITNTNNGKSVTAMVADVCPTCTNDNSLDLSVGAFTAIASESDGQVPITWYFN